MKVKVKTSLLLALSIMFLLPMGWRGTKWYFQNRAKQLFQEVSDNNDYHKMYVYYLQNESLDQALYGDNINEGKQLIQYYRKLKSYRKGVESGVIEREKIYSHTIEDSAYIEPITFPFKPKYLTVSESVYVKSDELSDSLVKGIVFNKNCWSYIEVFLFRETLHRLSPPDSLIDKLNSQLDHLSKSDKLFKKISPYNFYCN